MRSALPRLAITLGDPAGIGPEVAAKALLSPEAAACRPLLIGSRAALVFAIKNLPQPPDIVSVDPDDPFSQIPAPGQVALLETPPVLPPCGKASAEGGRSALDALDAASDLALSGRVDGIVTAPLSKDAVRLAGAATFTGHTEHLSARCGGVPVHMMMASDDLCVVLATTHLALSRVPAAISVDTVFETIRATHEALVRHAGLSAPRIAVCGLNPHPGEFGDEDIRVAEAVNRASRCGIEADGPHSADALFPRVVHQKSHDAVVALYHDQGLVPVKLTGFPAAVNVTLGLPFVRTAPGHGTAWDIAGRGCADPAGMIAALAWAARWSAPRSAQAAG
ncbi:MAG: 4-hydroxythreonine-4-phosphate dehydrogenase PdxA [Leptospirillia bacterium]